MYYRTIVHPLSFPLHRATKREKTQLHLQEEQQADQEQGYQKEQQ
jgi:hypothetical protein